MGKDYMGLGGLVFRIDLCRFRVDVLCEVWICQFGVYWFAILEFTS